jgi:hypothetical protein
VMSWERMQVKYLGMSRGFCDKRQLWESGKNGL